MRKIAIISALLGLVLAETNLEREVSMKTATIIQSPKKRKNYRNHLMRSYYGKGGCKRSACYRR